MLRPSSVRPRFFWSAAVLPPLSRLKLRRDINHGGTMSSGVQMQQHHERPNSERGGVVVLDFGGQYTQLIARRIREQQVFSSVLPCTTTLDEIRRFEPVGLILSGGPSSAYDADAPTCDHGVLAMGIPVLGICYGMHWI